MERKNSKFSLSTNGKEMAQTSKSNELHLIRCMLSSERVYTEICEEDRRTLKYIHNGIFNLYQLKHVQPIRRFLVSSSQ